MNISIQSWQQFQCQIMALNCARSAASSSTHGLSCITFTTMQRLWATRWRAIRITKYTACYTHGETSAYLVHRQSRRYLRQKFHRHSSNIRIRNQSVDNVRCIFARNQQWRDWLRTGMPLEPCFQRKAQKRIRMRQLTATT